jgi:hypothetical protein
MGEPGPKMSIKNFEIVEKMKMKAIHRCAERIEEATKDGNTHKIDNHSQFGISARLKSNYGL